MGWFAIYNAATGALVSVGTVVADPLPANLASVAVGVVTPTGIWNVTTRVFDAAPIIKPAIAPIDFLRRFTFAEEVAIRTAAKTDVGIEVFLGRLNATVAVHLGEADTINGVNYLLAKSLLTPARAAEILA